MELTREAAVRRTQAGLSAEAQPKTMFGYAVPGSVSKAQNVLSPELCMPEPELPRASGGVFPMVPIRRFAN
jgi:hypothetical protein